MASPSDFAARGLPEEVERGLTFEPAFDGNGLIPAIVTDAAEWAADLIVLGAPRRRELRTRLFGSVTLRVLQHAPCPVLVARAASRDRRHRAEQERYAGHQS